MLTSDPHAWLYAIFARLSNNRTFGLLSLSQQFEILRSAVAVDDPAKAESMQEWSLAMKDNLLLHLANTVRQGSPASCNILWRVTKGTRALECFAR
jgi:hypothetical protein